MSVVKSAVSNRDPILQSGLRSDSFHKALRESNEALACNQYDGCGCHEVSGGQFTKFNEATSFCISADLCLYNAL